MWPNLFARKQKEEAPPVIDFKDPETPDALVRRLHWTVLRPLATYLGGDEASRHRGPGMELTEVREYQPGDDIRFIDWNITARADQPYVRESHVERALDVWFILDLSASINWGTARCLKMDQAIEFTAVAGQVLNRNGNRLGAVLFANKIVQIVPPATGRMHLMHMLSKIREKSVQADTGETDLAEALKSAYTIIPRRSLVLVVSDFIVTHDWQSNLGKLAQRHEVVAVRLFDPREGELPDVGLVTLEDPETGAQLFIDTGDHKLRKRFQEAAQSQRDTIHSGIIRCGVEPLHLSTDDDLLPAFIQFLQLRRKRRSQGLKR